jgi:hypothetical protein
MEWDNFSKISEETGLVMKSTHTLVDKWPTRLKREPGTLEAIEEYRHLMASKLTFVELFVEWKWKE